MSEEERQSLHDYLKIWIDEKTKQGFEFDKNLLTVVGVVNGAALLAMRQVLPDALWSKMLMDVAILCLTGAVGTILSNQLLAAATRDHQIKRTHRVLAGEMDIDKYYDFESDETRKKMDASIKSRNKIALGLSLVVILLTMVSITLGNLKPTMSADVGGIAMSKKDDGSKQKESEGATTPPRPAKPPVKKDKPVEPKKK